MSLLLVLVAAPTVFAMAVWVLVTALRILRPEEPGRVPIEPAVVQLARMPMRPVVAAGGGTAGQYPGRDLWREFHHAEYDYGDGLSDGLPEAWWDDVVRRRN